MIERLKALDFEAVWEIMDLSFPRDEHRPKEEQRALFDDPAYRVYGTRDGEGRVIAFMAVWELEEIIFLEHFAVRPECRNSGIGGRFLRELIDSFPRQACLEVELPETELARRRIAFYERNGLFYHDYPYVQPALSVGQGSIPLRIMTSLAPIDEARFAVIRDALYQKIYHV